MDVHLLTAVHHGLSEHLEETGGSVERLREAAKSRGVRILWHVVVDGPGTIPKAPPAADSFHQTGRAAGVSACRNLALGVTEGDGWVFRLDGDDELDVQGWVGLLDDPHFGTVEWHPTNLTDFNGRPTVHWFDERKRWPKGSVEESWSSPMAFHPNNVVARSDLALAVGGWPALRVNEDILWCFALNREAEGLALPHVTLRYRQWEHQVVAGEEYAKDKRQHFDLITAMVNARRRREGQDPIHTPAVLPASLHLPRL